MMTCDVCGKLYLPKNLKREASTNFRKCEECYYNKKAQSSLASANRKSPTEFMRLERRIEKLEKKNEMLETIIESMVNEKVNMVIGDSLLSFVKQETQLQLGKLQAQIIDVNNKVVKIMGFELPKGE